MKNSNSKDAIGQYCLIFYHIEKTAGTTFNDILTRQYKGRHTYHLHGRQRRQEMAAFKDMSEEQRSNIYCITGHMSHLLANDVPLPKKYVTFLRDPMTQVLSGYQYAKNVSRTKAHDRIKNLETIDEYFDWQLEDSRDNIQTRYLSNTTRFMVSETGIIDMQKNGKRYLDEAKIKLESIDHVFITEDFDAALLMLKSQLKWPNNIYYQRKNTNSHHEKLTKSQEQRLRKIHSLDFELYELAKIRHQQAIENEGSDFKERLRKYQKVNNNAGTLISGNRTKKVIRTIMHHGRERGFLPKKRNR